MSTTTQPGRGSSSSMPHPSQLRAIAEPVPSWKPCRIGSIRGPLPPCIHQFTNAEHHGVSSRLAPHFPIDVLARYSRMCGLCSSPRTSFTPSSPRATSSQGAGCAGVALFSTFARSSIASLSRSTAVCSSARDRSVASIASRSLSVIGLSPGRRFVPSTIVNRGMVGGSLRARHRGAGAARGVPRLEQLAGPRMNGIPRPSACWPPIGPWAG